MTKDQIQVMIELGIIRNPIIAAAVMHVASGGTQAEAHHKYNLPRSRITEAVGRVRRTHEMITAAYSNKSA